MKPLHLNTSLAERAYQALVDEILDGRLQAGAHLVQEQLAADLGVSRQPIQQAMALLKADGLVEEVGRRGLRVAGLDVLRMRGHYDVRALLDGHAARRAAVVIRSGASDPAFLRARADEILTAGAAAVRSASIRDQIQHDEAFHELIYEASGNPVLSETAGPNWRYLRRVMADVLRHAAPAESIWGQHRAIVEAILAGDADAAETRAREHVTGAARRLAEALEGWSSSNLQKGVNR